jgi:collagen type III alpha
MKGMTMRQPLELWGQRGWAGQDIAGESHYTDAIVKVLGTVGDQWKEVQATAQLLPEPTNKYDRNAVQVVIGGSLVGYLPKEDAVRYAPVLAPVVDAGWLPQVAATVRGAVLEDYDYDRRGRAVTTKKLVGNVRLDLAEPHMLVPANIPPDAAHALLPRGGAIQVTGEEAYLSTLAPLVGPANECWIHVTLHEVTEQSARSSKTLVEVRVDGLPGGKLSPKMSGELLPAVRHLTDKGLTTAARAILKGNQLKADIVLYCARAGELPADWLSNPPVSGASAPASPAGAVIESETIASSDGPRSTTATAWRFNPPPSWPPAPPGWIPPEGWTPPPSLPPAPDGWQWWLPA